MPVRLAFVVDGDNNQADRPARPRGQCESHQLDPQHTSGKVSCVSLQYLGQFNQKTRKFINTKEESPIDLIAGGPPPCKTIVLPLQQGMQLIPTARSSWIEGFEADFVYMSIVKRG
jgi:hypothetical protein